MGELMQEIKAKYYFDGIKFNKRQLTNRQIGEVYRIKPRVKFNAFTYRPNENYKPIEKILFIKIVRACRDYMRAGMSKEAERPFYNKLSVVFDAMPK